MGKKYDFFYAFKFETQFKIQPLKTHQVDYIKNFFSRYGHFCDTWDGYANAMVADALAPCLT